jgi:hypothetical protein
MASYSTCYMDPSVAYAQQNALVLYNPMAMYAPQVMHPYAAYHHTGYGAVPSPYTNFQAQANTEQEKYCAKRLTDDPLNEISDILFGKKELQAPKGKTVQDGDARGAAAAAAATWLSTSCKALGVGR